MASLMSCSFIIVNIWDGRKSIKSALKQSDFLAHIPTWRVLNSAIQTKAKIYSGLWQLPKQSNYCSCQSVLVYSKYFWESNWTVHWPSDYEDDNTELVLINSTLHFSVWYPNSQRSQSSSLLTFGKEKSQVFNNTERTPKQRKHSCLSSTSRLISSDSI